MRIRTLVLGALVVVVAFVGTTFLIDLFLPPKVSLQQNRPTLVAVPPLQPLSGKSTVLMPTAIALTVIRDALEAQAPRNLSGTPQNPLPQLLSDAKLSFDVTRGPLAVSGQPGVLAVSTQLTGGFEVLGTVVGGVGTGVSAVATLGNLIGGSLGQGVQNLAGKTFDQHADLQGAVIATSRPTITPNWRLAPNLSGQVNVADVTLPIAGIKFNVAGAMKPALEAAVREQTGTLEARLRNDPFIETAARSEWAKLCQSISLGAAAQGMPDLWLEVRPVRAIAAQPKIDAKAVTLLVGVQAETRIVAHQTKPNCPFPQTLDIVPQINEGSVAVAMPIDIPFTEVNRLLQAEIKDKTFPEDGSLSLAATVRQAAIAPSGDRLLISLVVNVKERGLFSLGADATVHLWGRPVLDQANQMLRFTDITLDVQSQAAFGLAGAAAQAALPYLQKMLADKAVIDLKSFTADAKKRITAAVSGFTRRSGNMTANVDIQDLRLVGVAYDDKTLRVIANAAGTASVVITKLDMQ